MFGMMGLPDMAEMVRQVEDWKNKLERLVQAVERTQRDIEAIKSALGIAEAVKTLEAIETRIETREQRFGEKWENQDNGH